MTQFEKKKQFLLKNEDYLLNTISHHFGFTQLQLRKYSSIINWNAVVQNCNVKWDTKIIDEFSKCIFEGDAIIPAFNMNMALPWSIKFIERYEDLWEWELLAQNPLVMGNPKIRNHFLPYLNQYLEAYRERMEKRYTYFVKHGHEYKNDLKSNLDNFQYHKELQFQQPNEISKAKDIDWNLLSQNLLLPWSAELIEKHIDNWNWSALSMNPSIDWDFDLIKYFEQEIDWNVKVIEKYGITLSSESGISANPKIEWDGKLLSAFFSKLNSCNISHSKSVKWDIDLLIQFNDNWEMHYLSANECLWNKVFHEFHEAENLNPLLNFILEKHNDETD